MYFVYTCSIGERTCVYYLRRVVRTQATKTLETYLQRIKGLTASYPDTALSPPGNSSEMTVVPRMATANTDDSSWAGWAISSFTKKLNTTSGEIERGSAPNNNSCNDANPLFAPAMSASKVSSTPHLTKQAVTPFPLKSVFRGGQDNEDNDPDAWGDLEEEDFFDAPVSPLNPRTLVPVTTDTIGGATWDHGTVSDISSVFKKSKSPLPKGLVTMSSTVPGPRGAPRTGFGLSFPNAGETLAAPAKQAGTIRSSVAARKIETKDVQDPWGTGDEEDWGEAWDK